MSFSERMKLVSEKRIQLNDISPELRNRIANKIEEDFDDKQARYVLDILGYRTVSEKDPLNIMGDENLKNLTTRLIELSWNQVYDVIEHGYNFLKNRYNDYSGACNSDYAEYNKENCFCEHKDKLTEYSKSFNSILEQEKSGYRIIVGLITPITGEVEMACIEEVSSSKFYSVKNHLQKALQLYSDRKNPDYENSIKESISAVEAMCCIITGMTGASATLGAALKKLEDNGVVIHSALREAFAKIYGYASDANGIRHGGIDFKNAPSEDAKYMLISCSAFVNYLIEKHSKIGGTN